MNNLNDLKTENGSPIPTATTQGNGETAKGTVSEFRKVNVCPTPAATCDYHRGYLCRRARACSSAGLIDAETVQAAQGIRAAAAAAIQDTIFPDTQPFNPRKFIGDVIGS